MAVRSNISKYQLGEAEIYFENKGNRQGKIIVTHGSRSYSSFFNAMGYETIEEFICNINGEYFANNLCSQKFTPSVKLTIKSIRRYIRDEVPFHRVMEFQKEFRVKLKELENLEDIEFLFMELKSISIDMDDDNLYKHEIEEIKSIFENITKWPHEFVENELTDEYKWLYNLHGKLIKKIVK